MAEEDDEEVARDSRYHCPKPVMALCLCYGVVLGLHYSLLVAKPLYVTEDLMLGRSMGLFLSHFPAGVRLMGGIIAAVLADSYFGKFDVMASSYCLVFLITGPLITMSTWHSFELSTRRTLYIVGVISDLIVGFGSVVHPAFIAEQFKMPQQEYTLQTYYMFDYFYYNVCVAVLEFVTLEYTFEVSCLGGPKCYQIIYITFYISYGLSTLLFLAMKKLYVIRMPVRSVIKDAISCIWTALKNRRKMRDQTNVHYEHWLDWADCFDQQWRDDLRRVGRIMTMLFPYFVYYFLYAQINSMWIYQACRLDGRVSEHWTMKPSQVEALNPIVIISVAPLVEFVLNPILEKLKFFHTPLQRIGLAYSLTIVAFIMAAVLQLYIDRNSSPTFTVGKAQFRLFNTLNQNIDLKSTWANVHVKPYSVAQLLELDADGTINTKLDVKLPNSTLSQTISAEEGKGTNYVVMETGVKRLNQILDNSLLTSLRPSILIIIAERCNGQFYINYGKQYFTETYDLEKMKEESFTITLKSAGPAKFYLNNRIIAQHYIGDGGLYSLLFHKESPTDLKCVMEMSTLIKPNTINIMWIFPQYIIITIAEIFLYVSTNMFVYTQSPPTMRSVVRGLFTAGNSLAQMTLGAVVLIRVPEVIWFFSLAGTLVFATIIHIIMAKRYTYQKAHD
ncbi:solute carrier family 15 member 1-like [Rhodnius prolixus]|uniref:solute carrier family 15 member 1-like n=1 Tax=Rhodnius prolixus TaxID=13249 RepID=UPI003D18AD07